MEQRWFQTIRSTSLTQYTFLSSLFSNFDEGAGYYTSTKTINPVKVEQLHNLLDHLTSKDVEVRFTPSLKPLSQWLLGQSYHFSMIRMRNAK
ncbi:DUF6886 family protein [Bacillus sp. DJP31]|uniref:DUF6886 family protein n=1 Tax=Bacillus sp. DJP31 TaxID=3409789 RepID=UPI003BB7D39D